MPKPKPLDRVRTSGFAYEEFAAYLTECESLLESADEVDALYDSFESVCEQCDEDHAGSRSVTAAKSPAWKESSPLTSATRAPVNASRPRS